MDVNVESIVGADFVMPGQRVDIVSMTVGNDGTSRAETVLQEVLVVGGDQPMANGVSLLVPIELAGKLRAAQKAGTIGLVLER